MSNEIDAIREAIVTKVYHITPDMKVPPHRHDDNDEIFYCIKGSGIGTLEGTETVLTVGKVFIVPAGELHTLKTDSKLYVTSFLIPLMK